jgi:hypothetical protein
LDFLLVNQWIHNFIPFILLFYYFINFLNKKLCTYFYKAYWNRFSLDYLG